LNDREALECWTSVSMTGIVFDRHRLPAAPCRLRTIALRQGAFLKTLTRRGGDGAVGGDRAFYPECRKQFFDFQKIVHDDVASVEFSANPQVTILAKKVKNYAPTAEGIRGSFSELYLQE
jgi:hypothetical protein